MNWQQLRNEIDLFEREVATQQPEQPIRELSETDKRIEARLKPNMDASEVDEIVNQEYNRQPLPACEYYKCPTPARERIMFNSGMTACYCETHAKTFDDEMIEEREDLQEAAQ